MLQKQQYELDSKPLAAVFDDAALEFQRKLMAENYAMLMTILLCIRLVRAQAVFAVFMRNTAGSASPDAVRRSLCGV